MREAFVLETQGFLNPKTLYFVTEVCRNVFILCIIDPSLEFLHIGGVDGFQLFQIVSCQQGKDVGSKGEVVPLVQPLIPHVDCSEVLYVVASPWLDVLYGGRHHCVHVVIGQKGLKQCR